MSDENKEPSVDTQNNIKPSKVKYKNPPSLKTKRVGLWNNYEVCCWIASLENGKFIDECVKFKDNNVDGNKLLGLDRLILQNDIKVLDVSARNTILKSIKILKDKMKTIESNKINKWASKHKRRSGKNDYDASKRVYVTVTRIERDPFNIDIIKSKSGDAVGKINFKKNVEIIKENEGMILIKVSHKKYVCY